MNLWTSLIIILSRKFPYLDKDVFFWRKSHRSVLGSSKKKNITPPLLSKESPQSTHTYKQSLKLEDTVVEREEVVENVSLKKTETPDYQEKKLPINSSLPTLVFSISLPVVNNDELISIFNDSPESFNLWREASAFKKIVIRDLDLSGRNLCETQWKHCTLINVDFSESQLKNASFEDAIIRNVNFDKADLYDCSFKNVDLNNSLGLDLKSLNLHNLISNNRWLMKSLIDEYMPDSNEYDIKLDFLRICQTPLNKNEISRRLNLKAKSSLFKLTLKELIDKKLILVKASDNPKNQPKIYQTSSEGLDIYQKSYSQADSNFMLD